MAAPVPTDDELKREFYSKLLVRSGQKKPAKQSDEELVQLYKVPKKDKAKEIPRNRNTVPESFYQADVSVYMPTDGEFAYLLVVVDTANGVTDAKPITAVTQEEVISALI